ncbi:hypothetical protein roselon_03315 [Roseibacterium elongatum DSM 19469]|uniref:Glutaredoxin domain-containing protein n=1 Tax=Roseicyclus elongatus DSM 19469 TaxID=1294273 RepID=W8RW82_9RHOB|nr:hypothetical protein roselon_03315 [Roseibacterium elongatum DSM 19469]
MARGAAALTVWVVMVFALLAPSPGGAQTPEVRAYVFWQQGCPYCELAREALRALSAEMDGVQVGEIELGASLEANLLFREVAGRLEIASPAVPLFVVGPRYQIGFARDGSTRETYRQMIAACRDALCPDVVAGARHAAAGTPQTHPPAPAPSAPQAPALERRVSLPLLGEVDLGDLSLPALTVALAAVDGFNPCAMWVLALLIGFLLGVREPWRMWTLGAIFLLTTAAMYFAVMAAWLNIVMWLGALSWLRLVIGALALVAGGYYLREYWTNPEGVCRVTPSARRQTIRAAFQRLVEEPNIVIAGLGIAVLAVGVNLIELACSAGIPAIYTQTLAMHDPAPAASLGYLALYIAVFLLDDTAIFVVAMVTLRAVSGSGTLSRLSHLVGGIVLLGLGALMILRPDLLS